MEFGSHRGFKVGFSLVGHGIIVEVMNSSLKNMKFQGRIDEFSSGHNEGKHNMHNGRKN